MARQTFTISHEDYTLTTSWFLSNTQRDGGGSGVGVINSDFTVDPSVATLVDRIDLILLSSTRYLRIDIVRVDPTNRAGTLNLTSQFLSSGKVTFAQTGVGSSITLNLIDLRRTTPTGNALLVETQWAIPLSDRANLQNMFTRMRDLSEDVSVTFFDGIEPITEFEIAPTFNAATATSTFAPSFTHIKVIKTIEIDPMLGDGRITSTTAIEVIKREAPDPINTYEIPEWEQRLNQELQLIPEGNGFPSLSERVYPDVYVADLDADGGGFDIPHVVYSQLGFSTTDALEGSLQTTISVSLDFRSPDRKQAAMMASVSLRKLKASGMIVRVFTQITLYDVETELFRNIVDVSINPYRHIEPKRLTGLRPWGNQFDLHFG